MPQLDESVAAHLCPPTAIGWKAKASHPSKPCRTTSALAGRSYASAVPAASALHSMAVLQVYQAKLLSAIDESEPDPATLRELRNATDLALRATKTTAQAIGRSMASLVVLERHLWLTLTEIKDADRVSFLDAPISPSGLFGPAVKGFAERFTEAQKASQAMRHFLPKRSSPAATMQLSAVIVEKIKHKHSQKESNFPLPSLTSALPPCSRPLEFIQPLATRAEAWQDIPRVSEWVMATIKQGYSLQFARRPPRFSGVVSTSVQG